MKYLGVDYGTKRIGLAVSDEGGVLAFPHKIIPTNREALQRVSTIVTEQYIDAIVMGKSETFSGEDNPVMHDARIFADMLAQETGKEVLWHTEVLTSQHARRGGEALKRPVARKQKHERQASVDDSAAALILQSFLDLHGKR